MPDRLTVFITGASAGIGAACARAFAAKGDRVILAARSRGALDDLAADLNDALGEGTALVVPLDVTDAQAHLDVVAGLPDDWAEVDVAVLNAGLSKGLDPVWENTVDGRRPDGRRQRQGRRQRLPRRSCRGCWRAGAVTSSRWGRRPPTPSTRAAWSTAPPRRPCCALTNGLKVDLHGTPVRATTVSPGIVETDFSLVRFDGDRERADAVYADTNALTAEDVADAVVYCAHAPERVNVQELLLTPRVQSGYTMIARGEQAEGL